MGWTLLTFAITIFIVALFIRRKEQRPSIVAEKILPSAQPEMPSRQFIPSASFVKPSIPRQDPPEMVGEKPEKVEINVVFGLRYVDASGFFSERRIRLLSVVKGSNLAPDALYLKAWCFEREDYRTFRADRIEELINLDTGEVINNPLKWCKKLFGIEPNSTSALLTELSAEIYILIYVATIDAEFHILEREKIIDFIMSCAEEEVDQEAIHAYCMSIQADRELFVFAANDVAKWKASRRNRLARAILAVIKVDKKIEAAEEKIIAELQDLAGKITAFQPKKRKSSGKEKALQS